MTSTSQITTDHDTIRQWAEARGGKPATVSGTGDGDDAGLLRIDFDVDGKDDRLEPLSWDDFFEKFEEARLAFLYQDEKTSGEGSTFFKFVKRES
ncbi:MAG: hypothetical protein AB7G88_07560 [Thermomicrobiales bacterium]